ncbi:hypothetical protein AVEN_188174-1 [Araneus ventricosus]|uniref:Uncharacterized protein n=1 Tax=Araneus ventricosus TaxID=182803 RepID=A0A4Y2I977_ARAVE|nr:hypothetical protein AVEN_188174-1 [Araneus ventricosus]
MQRTNSSVINDGRSLRSSSWTFPLPKIDILTHFLTIPSLTSRSLHPKFSFEGNRTFAVGYSDRDIQYKWNPARSVVIASDMKLSMFDVTDTPTGNLTEEQRKG